MYKSVPDPAGQKTKHESTTAMIEEAMIEEDDYLEENETKAHVVDPMTYNNMWLKSWMVFYNLKNTIWHNSDLWSMMAKLLILSLAVGVLCYFCMTNSANLDTSKFDDITTFINIFVSLMLSFFLSESVSRWSSCVDGYLKLFNSIRNLSLQFHALGIDRDMHHLALRYGVLSTFFLHNELKRKSLPVEQQQPNWNKMWENIRKNSPALAAKNSKKYVTEKEQAILEGVQDCAGQMWLWVGTLVGHMAKSGEVPGMATPTYGRILSLCQDAQEGVRQVRTSIFVKLPFVYVHTLATLVHVTNILFAISLGCTLGSASGGIVRYAKSVWYGEAVPAYLPIQQVQSIVIETLKCALGPLLYQAFFELGCSISAPFSHPDGAIPVSKMIHALERDLLDSEKLADNLPNWDTPCFKDKV